MTRSTTPDILGAVLGPAPTAAQILPLTAVRTDGGTQMRAALDPATVAEYAEIMTLADGWGTFPPVVVFYDGETHWLADGFHRVAAARQAVTVGEIVADVRAGTRRDAVLYAAQANAHHGLRRTTADKRRAVNALLADPEWSAWSDREIARRCQVSNTFVAQLRALVTVNVDSENGKHNGTARTYTTRHGSPATMDIAKIGHARRVAATVPTPPPAPLAPVPRDPAGVTVAALDEPDDDDAPAVDFLTPVPGSDPRIGKLTQVRARLNAARDALTMLDEVTGRYSATGECRRALAAMVQMCDDELEDLQRGKPREWGEF